MGRYALDQLTPWVRRLSGDRISRERESLIADGSDSLALGHDGAVTLTSLTVDDVPLLDGYAVEGSVIIFDAPPADGSAVLAVYSASRYSDNDLLEFVIDGARMVISDLNIPLVIDTDELVDAANATISAVGVLIPDVERLIAMRSAIQAYTDKANQAADDAIQIRDGDTSIYTSETSRSSEKALARLEKSYTDTMSHIRMRRSRGDWAEFTHGT